LVFILKLVFAFYWTRLLFLLVGATILSFRLLVVPVTGCCQLLGAMIFVLSYDAGGVILFALPLCWVLSSIVRFHMLDRAEAKLVQLLDLATWDSPGGEDKYGPEVLMIRGTGKAVSRHGPTKLYYFGCHLSCGFDGAEAG
jgi:hypothetical protein